MKENKQEKNNCGIKKNFMWCQQKEAEIIYGNTSLERASVVKHSETGKREEEKDRYHATGGHNYHGNYHWAFPLWLY